MAYVSNIDAGKMSVFQGRYKSRPNALKILHQWTTGILATRCCGTQDPSGSREFQTSQALCI